MVGDYEVGLEGAGEVFGRAKGWWSVWERGAWGMTSKRVSQSSNRKLEGTEVIGLMHPGQSGASCRRIGIRT